MDSSVSPKDEIWFLLVCHHISTDICPSIILHGVWKKKPLQELSHILSVLCVKVQEGRRAYLSIWIFTHYNTERTACVVVQLFGKRDYKPRSILYYNGNMFLILTPFSLIKSVTKFRSNVSSALKSSQHVNRLTPNDPYMGRTNPYMGRTTPLTSKRHILYIYSTNIGAEYFKHALYSSFFSLKMQFVS